jgi:SnoaL-like domain
MKIQRSGDCGNSPKNVFAEELTIALAKRDASSLDERLTDDVRWHRVGQTTVDGKSAFMDALEKLRRQPLARLSVSHVLNHGRVAAVNGVVEDAHGCVADFCNVYEFSNLKGNCVKTITAYEIARD